MAPKEAKKRMKASEHKKYKLLQTTMGPTPRIVIGFHLFNEFICSMNLCNLSFHLLHGFIYYMNYLCNLSFHLLHGFIYYMNSIVLVYYMNSPMFVFMNY